MLNFCLRKASDLGSPVVNDRRRPSYLMKLKACGPQRPRVSIASGVKIYVSLMEAYFLFFFSSAEMLIIIIIIIIIITVYYKSIF